MKKILSLVIIIGLCSSCSFLREMEVQGTIKDGQYGIAKGNGDVLYKSKTSFSFLWKEITFEECNEPVPTD